MAAALIGTWLTCVASARKRPRTAASYEQAQALLAQHQFARAVPLLERILKTSPRDVRVRNLLGLALTGAGKIDEANRHFRKAIAIDPKFYPALKYLGINELASGHAEKARAHLERAAAMAPQDRLIQMTLGETYYSERQYSRAVDHYLKSVGLFLKEPHTTLHFAESCFASNQPEKAEGALEMLGTEADGKAHFQAGLMLAQMRKYESAAKQFGLARRDYPDPYEVGYNLTLADIRAMKYSEAIQVAEELILKGYKKAELYNLLAEAYERSGRTVDAYNALRTATQLEPRDENNYLDLVALGVDHRNYDLAFGIIEIGLQNIPNSFRLRLQRGAVLAFQGQLTRALADFEEAAKLDPQKDLPYFGVVMALMQTDQAAKAREILHQRLAVHPDDYLLLYALGEMQDRLGAPPGSPQEEEAIRALERSVQLEPNMSTSRIALGRILLRHGDIDRAIVELEKALEINPEDLSPCYQLSMAYRRKGDVEKADELQARFERFKAEDRERYMNVQILRLLREGEK